VNRRTFFLVAAGLLVAGAAQAQQLEIIPLQHRTAEQVLPALRPLLEPGGVLSGAQGQLFVRTSPRNLEEIKAALAAMDRPLRRLLISVRQSSSAVAERGGASVSGTIQQGHVVLGSQPAGAPPQRGATVRIDDSRTSAANQLVQQVQAVEGAPALIEIGQELPIVTRMGTATPGGATLSESAVYHDVSSGFEVVAQIIGEDRVVLEISPRREAATRSGAIDVQRVVSTASGRLGEWLELGAITRERTSQGSEILARSAAERQSISGVWVKVEEIR
jgi:type II secretory pathway component GspD/PulD (secretin)